MFEFLLKFSPVVFQEGDFTFNYSPSILTVFAVAICLIFSLWYVYRKTTLEINSRLKGILIGFKIFVITLLMFALLEPIVRVSTVIPRKSALILMVDDSKSMTIKDSNNNNLSRKEYLMALLGNESNSALLAELQNNFKIQMFKFSSEVEPLNNSENLSAQGEVTNVTESLKFAEELGAQSSVAGILLFTDGADNGGSDPLEVAALLKNKKLPVYVVGVGNENLDDIEISKVAANHSVIENSVVEISALIKHKMYENKEVEIELREKGVLVKKQSENLNGTATRISMKFSPQKSGFVRYAINVVAQEKETIKENNSKSFIIDNRNKKAKVLYIEGYPRAEFKYLRRALDGDENLELVSLLRTGPDKFYRQGIKNQNELKSGYPKTKEALFKYDAIIFGSIEAAFFTPKELENTLEFVSQRGGGFLMLGGDNSFAQGGYSKMPIEKMLPVEFPHAGSASISTPATFRDKFKLVLTPEGLRNSILQLSPVESENRACWENLPELEGYNPLGRAKPAATILAVHPLSEIDNPKIILALQRFGRGRTMVFATSSSWHWQMGMSHEDTSHERFWRQMLRWLALSAPKPLEGHLDKETYVPGEKVALNVDVRDSTYTVIENATIKATVTTPSGKIVEIPFNWSTNGKVEYTGTHYPDEDGMHLVDILAYSSKGEFLGKTETAFFVEESKAEFTHAQLQSGLLKRIAEISGGKYYHQDEARNLPDEIAVMKSSYSKMVEYELWDVPLLFLLTILILSVEWYVRRSKGLS